MSFVGDLEHLPIVDLIQLLHSTKKSGTLGLKSKRGQSQLVFNEGYIVSANHHNNSIQVGQILVDMKAITAEQLETALEEQKNAGKNRKPLIATLIESGLINKEAAFNGLEMLIEMTIVDVLTWTSGTFELEIDNLTVSDEYRYFPDTLKEKLNLNTQSILMDALRIYDEKKRDGTLGQSTLLATDLPEEPVRTEEEDSGPLISASDLGLDDLDNLEKKIPEVFTGVKFFDPAEDYRQRLKDELKDLCAEDQQKLISYMVAPPALQRDSGQAGSPDLVVVLFSSDRLLTDLLTATCKVDHVPVFSTDSESDLKPIIDQAASKKSVPVLVLDAFDPTERHPALIKAQLAAHDKLVVIKLVSGSDVETTLGALKVGARTIFPKPERIESKTSFAERSMRFAESFRSYLQKISIINTCNLPIDPFYRCIQELQGAREIPDLSLAVLKFIAEICQRSLTFIVANGELIAERGIGIKSDKSAGPTPPLRFKVSLASPSIFQRSIDGLQLLFEKTDKDNSLESLFREIGAPLESKVLAVPIVSFSRVVALIYADFGTVAAGPVPTEMIAALAKHASLVFDNILMRKKLEKPA